MTIHDFDMARFFVRDIVEVHAYGGNAFSDYTQELGDFDSASVALRGSQGELVTIINSRHSSYGYDQRLEAFGSEGALMVENPLPTTVRHSYRQATRQQDTSPTYFVDRYAESYRRQLRAFVTAIRDHTPASPNYADGMAALHLAYAAAQSAATGRSVRIDEV